MIPENSSFFSAKGKLMLFGEYVVMRGVPALAFPVKMGQTLRVSEASEFIWQSYEANTLWFEVRFTPNLEIISTNQASVAEKLMSMMKDLKSINEHLFAQPLRFEVKSNFKRNWGFGTSSTLSSLLSQWSVVDPYVFNERHFGGSGYDIACATAQGPLLYYKESRHVEQVNIPIAITDKLLFVYLGKKQNSQNEVSKFSDLSISDAQLQRIKHLVLDVAQAQTIEQFEDVIDEHEKELSALLGRPTLKSLEFSDYDYSIKSLGAWGGDFFMATCRNLDEARMYFIEKNKEVSFTWSTLTD